MTDRPQRGLDLTPLLDVFMVVLFVFATLQENELDKSQDTVESLQANAADLEEQLSAIKARPEPSQDPLPPVSAAEVKELEASNEALKDQLDEVRREAKKAAEGLPQGENEALRRQELLSKLLDHFSVFEIEIAGVTDETGTVRNRCCYRTEPAAEGWDPCNDIPADSDERRQFIDNGAAGLIAALRKTKGGNAMTVIRQDENATFRISARLERDLRERFPEHKIYDEGLSVIDMACGEDGDAQRK